MAEENVLQVMIETNSFTEESFKTLRTNLLYVDNLQVITISSVSPDEGKTITSLNLAISFANLGKKVVIVDCDMKRSSLKYFFNSTNRLVGLSEFLTKQSQNCIYKTDINNLYYLPAGKRPPNSTELLSGEYMDKVIEKLKETFDYIIIDTPPFTASSDAIVVGRKSDGVLLVVRNEFTRKKDIERVKRDLERSGGRIVGAVLNRVKKNQVDYSYYGYGKYYY